MTTDSTFDRSALAAAAESARARYTQARQAGLRLDITRGKPSTAQLDLAEPLLGLPGAGDHATDVEGDVRNYGGAPQGLRALREVFAPLLQVPVDQLVVRDNASLALMHQCVSTSFFHAPPGGARRWMGEPVVFLAPVPGYDRHFAVCDELGVEMRTVAMTATGPDMDEVERLVADPSVKGIWCVPKYANPTGITYSDDVVDRLARMPTAAPDFRVYWDDAYAVHHLGGENEHDRLASIVEACAAAGNPERPLVFGSTSKVTFAGAGVSFFGSSPANVAWYLAHDGKRSIGPDKVNQLRHLRFLPDTDAVLAHMARHREILAPKFAVVAEVLEADLGPLGIARWSTPRGGYFVNLDVVPGTADRVVGLAADAGLALTPAGATYPGGRDPNDANLRIAPSFPTMDELEPAMRLLTVCVILAAAEKLL